MIETALKENEVDFVRGDLTRERWEHTRNVLDVAERVAEAYRLEKKPLQVAALFHDNARDLPETDQRKLAEAFRGELDPIEGRVQGLWHAPAGARRMVDRFDYDPGDVPVQAVAFHTTATPELTDCLKGLLVADFAEPGRSYNEADALRNKIGETPLTQLASTVIREKLIRTIKANHLIHDRTVRTHNTLCD